MPSAPTVTGESAFLEWVRQRQSLANRGHGHVLHSAGDDLAVLDWPGDLLLMGMDPVLDGVHVDLARCGPAAAGRKAVNRNLSDSAAMGATPVAITLCIVAPKSMRLEDVKQVYLGAEAAGLAFDCPIVGGDLASWDGRLVVTAGILARAARPVLRGTARPGETLFVSGPLGGSILGRHLSFTPRVALGMRAAGEFGATAMIDLSDGLSRDLPRLLGPPLGATIDADRVPIHEDARRLASETGRDLLWHALNDGEDYELLFSAPAAELPGCIAIGRVEPTAGVFLGRAGGREPLAPEGWEHGFSR